MQKQSKFAVLLARETRPGSMIVFTRRRPKTGKKPPFQHSLKARLIVLTLNHRVFPWKLALFGRARLTRVGSLEIVGLMTSDNWQMAVGYGWLPRVHRNCSFNFSRDVWERGGQRGGRRSLPSSNQLPVSSTEQSGACEKEIVFPLFSRSLAFIGQIEIEIEMSVMASVFHTGSNLYFSNKNGCLYSMKLYFHTYYFYF